MDFLALKRLFTRKIRNIEKIFPAKIDDKSDISSLLYWCGGNKNILRIILPMDMLVMQGGFSYSIGFHPFVAALRDGPQMLRWFYDHYQPGTIAEVYGLRASGRLGADAPPWELPWILRSLRAAPPGERGLGPEHGVSFYGPATDRKVALEHQRLSQTRASIEKYDYDPDRYGDITGFFLRSGKDYRFFVRGGKHRTAVLANLGFETIPVVMKPHWPRLIDRDRAHEWPLVQSGAMDEDLAREIFDRYFNPGGFDWLDAD